MTDVIGPPAGRGRVDGCSTLFVLVNLVFGTAFAVLTPAFVGQDELSHIARSYAIDHGHVFPQPIPGPQGTNYGGGFPATAYALYNDVSILVPDHSPAQVARYRQLGAAPIRGPLVQVGFPNTSAYSPVCYLPSVVGLRLAETAGASVWTAILLMRLTSLAFFTAVLWLALRVLRHHRVKWVVFVVALLPMTVFMASMVTADGPTDALAMLLGAFVIKGAFLNRGLSRAETIVLLLTAVLLPLTKPVYVLLDLAVFCIPTRSLALPRIRRFLPWAAAGTGFLLYGGWAVASARIQGAYHYMRPDVVLDPFRQAHGVLGDPLHFLRIGARTLAREIDLYVTQTVGELGVVYMRVPVTVVLACSVAALLAGGMSERLTADRRRTAAVAAIVLASAAAIFLVEYIDWARLGAAEIEGVQGRYFLPLALPAAAVALRVVPVRLDLAGLRVQRAIPAAIAVLSVGGLARTLLAWDRLLWH